MMKDCKKIAQNILGQLKKIDPNELVYGQMAEEIHVFPIPIKGIDLNCRFCGGTEGTKLQVKGRIFFVCLEKPCLDYAESKKKSQTSKHQ